MARGPSYRAVGCAKKWHGNTLPNRTSSAHRLSSTAVYRHAPLQLHNIHAGRRGLTDTPLQLGHYENAHILHIVFTYGWLFQCSSGRRYTYDVYWSIALWTQLLYWMWNQNLGAIRLLGNGFKSGAEGRLTSVTFEAQPTYAEITFDFDEVF